MAEDKEIERLRRRLRWEAGGRLTEISNQATASLFSALGSVAQWARQAGEERLRIPGQVGQAFRCHVGQ